MFRDFELGQVRIHGRGQWSVLLSIYVHRNHQAYQGRGAKDSHLDFHTASGCEQPGRWSWVLTAWTGCLAAAAELLATVGSLWTQSLPVTFASAQLLKEQVIYGLHKFLRTGKVLTTYNI